MAKHTNIFMNIKTEYDPTKDRQRLEKKAAEGWITPQAYWNNLKSSWYQMDESDKKEELSLIDPDLPTFLGGPEK